MDPAEKLAFFTTRRAPPEAGVDVVVLAPPNEDRAAAFALALTHVRAGKVVHLFGHGVTLEHAWPDWVTGCDALVLTEWGALHEDDRAFSERPLQDDLQAWLVEVFGDVLGPALYGPVACRVALSLFDLYPFARTIARTFPADVPIACIGDGPLEDLLAQLRGQPRPPHRRTWRARFLGTSAIALSGSIGKSLVERVRARASLRQIAALRSGTRPRPSSWVAMVPDWYRINHQLLDAFALGELERAGTLGVLLVGALTPGEAQEHDLTRRGGSALWPGLGPLRSELGRCTVEQAVMPEGTAAFARALGRGIRDSLAASWRLSSRRVLPMGGVDVDLTQDAWGLAAVATLDVLRATLARAATEDLADRGPFPGDAAIFCTGGAVIGAAASLALAERDVVTADHPHGGISDWLAAGELGPSQIVCSWEEQDRRGAEALGRTAITTGMPLRVKHAPRPPGRPIANVLLMTNYAHRDQEVRGYFPNEVLQREVLGVADRLREGRSLAFRWRPHPADIEAVVRREADARPWLELSRGRPIEEDGAWADLVVTSISTALLELLFAGLPIFAHVTPELWGLSQLDFLDASRCFWRADEGARLVLALLDGDPEDALAPERRAREKLFGPTGIPVAMAEYFGTRAKRPLPVQPFSQRSKTTPSTSATPSRR